MIQRIQSLFLLLAALGMALLLKFPIASYMAEPGIQNYTMAASLELIPKSNPNMLRQIEAGSGLVTMDPSNAALHTWPALTLAGICFVLALTCIFLYKNRILQMRLVAFALLVNVAYVGLLFLWLIDKYGKAAEGFAATLQCGPMHTIYEAGTWIPLATLALFFFAQRAIRKDELKVRAADRLR
ncbi:MAG: DUF4293 domain-containing protein [Bacteroidales bacterium]|nr:DUF4293 domain-containing protein [Bacteroidales bacterium]